MAQTHVSVYLHIVFSTKNRFPFITPEIEAELFAYIGGILSNLGCRLIAANGTDNHVHLLVSLDKNIQIPNLVGTIKRESSKCLKTKSSMLSKFGWQDGYSVFSVGHTQLPAVKKYISNQKQHHAKKLFEDEMRSFYRKYEIDFDEAYEWGLFGPFSVGATLLPSPTGINSIASGNTRRSGRQQIPSLKGTYIKRRGGSPTGSD